MVVLNDPMQTIKASRHYFKIDMLGHFEVDINHRDCFLVGEDAVYQRFGTLY